MLTDQPIRSIEEDKFNLEKSVTRFINQYITSDYSGSVLLNGKWGAGKTGFLNLIKSQSIKNAKFININFWENKWEHKPYEIILKEINWFKWRIIK